MHAHKAPEACRSPVLARNSPQRAGASTASASVRPGKRQSRRFSGVFTNALCALLLATTCLSGVRAEEKPFEAKKISMLSPADAAAYDQFGQSVSVWGSTIVVGANGDDDDGASSGSAYVFEKSDDGEWAQAAKLVAADAANGDEFGWSVSVSGSTIVVGPQYDDVDAGVKAGSATVFDSNPGSTASGDDSDADAASPASVSATFHNILDGYKFTTTITKTSDGTYNVTAEQENATMSGAFLGAKLGAAAAAAMSSPARAAAPVLALAAVAAAAGVAMNRSRRASRVSDEDAPLLKGAQYGAASV